MKFCILMPAYNAAKDIEKAIESVLSQTYPQFSLVVVNDGSTDNTADVINKFAHDERIKIITQNNTGIAGAYQNAFSHIDGDYVMFLDSDDALAPNGLEEIADKITKTQADIVQFGISYFDENWSHKRDLVFAEREIVSNETILLNYFNGINDGSDRPNLGIRAYKRDLLLDFEFPEIGSLGIDEILNLYAMTRCNKIAFTAKPYYLCQQRTDSVSRIKPSAKKVAGVLLSYKEMEKILLAQHSEFMDLLYLKFIRFYVSHLNIIKSLSTYKLHKEDFNRQIIIVNSSPRIHLNVKTKLRIFALAHFPFLSAVLSKY